MPFDEAAAGFLNRRPIQISEIFAECDEIVVGQILSAEQENRVVKPGSIDAREIIPRRPFADLLPEFPLRALFLLE